MPLPRRDTNFSTNITERSGWWAPIAVIVVVVLFSIFVLVYYFVPNPVSIIEERPSLSPRIDRVAVTVNDHAFMIPANFLVFASERKGGARHDIDIAASLPDFRGYTEAERAVFAGSDRNSPIVRIKIREDRFDVPEAERFARVYLEEVVDRRGTSQTSGLTHYLFRDDSGYRGEDLFAGRDGRTLVVIRCELPGADVPSPNCMRDYPLGAGAALGYRFKRAHLSDWRTIARGVTHLVSSFEIRKR